ncbi:hypothetical protein [Mariniflexile maritimum]|uniref:hypothetical protein n=1 Tax=Mariniflexile maritimum TaxID=2682493 RepID=UPI0012F6A6A5|nr:hypothetical protein [Mariniflexile maritimum]
MKKISLLIGLAVTFSYSQVTDQNGIFAVGSGGSSLTGNIGIGLTPSSSSNYKLEINGALKTVNLELTNSLPEGSTFINWNDLAKKSTVLNVGTLIDLSNGTRGMYFLDIPISNLTTKSLMYFGIDDRNLKQRFVFTAEANGASDLSLNDKNQIEYFKALEMSDGSKVVQMSNTNSRLRIGAFGNYLPEHKFVVKDGSAMIEGNILTNNNIGIGTNSFVDGVDNYRLSVEGKIRAHGVKVYTAWADFVFNKDYKLLPLDDVRKYIDINGHLPNIPSAKDVNEEGVELGSMSAKLLEKIEELTLYLLKQDAQIKVMETELSNLKKHRNG